MIPRTAIPIGNRELFSALFHATRNQDEEITNFEKSLARYLGVRKVYATSSGRAALLLALQALGLKTGERVIVPAYTCAIVFEVILRLGLKPTLVDVNPRTYNIDPRLIPGVITSKTKAVIPVHLFGRPCEMDEIMKIACKYDLSVVEDAAQALGAEYKGKKVGTIGDMAIFSFGPGKSITSGEGGALSTNNIELMNRITEIQGKLPNPGRHWSLHVIKNILSMKVFSNHYFYAFIRGYLEEVLNQSDLEILANCMRLGSNASDTNLYSTIKVMKMPSVSARIGSIQLKRINEFNHKRTANAHILTDYLSKVTHSIQLPRPDHESISTFTRYPVKLKKAPRENVKKELTKRGVDVETPYDYLTDFIRSYSDKRYAYTEDMCQTLMTIPTHPCLNSQDLHKIASTLIIACR